jgi:hypothetical protein
MKARTKKQKNEPAEAEESIRQHTYVSRRQHRNCGSGGKHRSAYVSIRQHTSTNEGTHKETEGRSTKKQKGEAQDKAEE